MNLNIRTFHVSGPLSFTVTNSDDGSTVTYSTEHCDVVLSYRIGDSALLQAQISPVEVELFAATMLHDAIFTEEEEVGFPTMMLATKGSAITSFVPREKWILWQQQIADDLNNHSPEDRK